MKWTDIVATNQQQLIVVTTPVSTTTTSIDALGDVGILIRHLMHARTFMELCATRSMHWELRLPRNESRIWFRPSL